MLSRTSVAALLALTLGLVVPGCGARPKTSGRRSPIQVPSRASDSDANARATEKVVIATGLGLNPDEARSHLRRSAIEQVVGALVDAELRIENGEVIEEIISASRAYVSSFEELEIRKLPSGLWEMRAKVGVQETQLRSRLVEAQIIDGVVDGQSLFARSLSRIDQAQDHEALITRVLQDYPSCALACRVGEIRVLEDVGDEWTIGVPITFELDEEGWDQCMAELRPVLDSVARTKKTLRRLQRGRMHTDGKAHWDLPNFLVAHKWFSNRRSRQSWQDDVLSFLKTEAGKLGNDEFWWAVPAGPQLSDAWELFAVPRRLLPAVALFSTRHLVLNVTVKSEDGVTLESTQLTCPVAPVRSHQGGRASASATPPWISSYDRLKVPWSAERLLTAADDYAPHFFLLPNWLMPHGNGADASPTLSVSLALALSISKADVRRAESIDVEIHAFDPEWTFQYHPVHGAAEAISVSLPSLIRK